MTCVLCSREVLEDQRLCLPCIREERLKHRLPHQTGMTYPFAEMAVGEERIIDRPRHNVAPAACQYGVRHGVQFSTRKLSDTRCRLTRIT